MSDFAVSIAVGATLGASVGRVTGSTVKHLERLNKTVGATEKASRQVAGYRAMRSALGDATASMRAAERRVGELRREIVSTRRPSEDLRRRFADARAESRRLTEAVGRQRRALIGQARAMKESGVNARRLAAEEGRLTDKLRKQTAYRDRLTAQMTARTAARGRRESARGDIVEAAALGYAVLRPVQAMVGKAVEFEEKMADVGKVVDFPAPGGLKEMGKDILALSTRIPVAAAGIADIVAAAGQANIARSELLRFAEDTAKVAVAFDMAGGEAGGAMTGLRSIFKLGQKGAMDLAGAYNHLSNNMDATAPAMLNIANRAGSVGVQFGLSGQQVGALGATFLALKTPPEVAATGINAMLQKLQNADRQPKKFQQALDNLGLSAAGLKDHIARDAQGALLAFLDAVAKSDDVSGHLFDLFGQEYSDDMAKLVGGLDMYRRAVRLASAAEANAASVEKEYAVRADTTANALQQLSGQATRLAINIGETLLPAVNAALEPIGAVVDVASTLAERFPRVTAAVVGLTAGFVVGKIALVAYRYAAASVEEVWRTGRIGLMRVLSTLAEKKARVIELTRATWAATASARWHTGALARLPVVGAAGAVGIGKVSTSLRILRLALISTGIGAIVVGIGMAIGWLVAHWDGVKAFFRGFAEGIGGVLDALGPVGRVIRAIGSAIKTAFGWIGRLFSFDPVEDGNVGKWEAAGKTTGAVAGALIRRMLPGFATEEDEGQDAPGKKEQVGKAAANTPQPGDAVSPRKRRRAGAAAAAAGAAFAVAEPPPLPPQPAPPLPPAVTGQPTFQQPPAQAATTVTVHVGDIVIQPPPGADADEIAAIVHRELAAALRRGAVEAGLSESD